MTRTRRRCCRPRGRKARTAVSRWSQASRVGRLGAQGASGAMTGFAVTSWHYDDGTSSTEQQRRRREKQGRRTEKNGDGEDFIARLRSKKKPRHGLLHTSAKPNVATSAPGTPTVRCRPKTLFTEITELPLVYFPKLLPN